MNDNANIKLEEEDKVEEEIDNENFKKGFAFLNESEIIINQIIEKIISLVITYSTRNKIDRLLPNYCFQELKQSIEILSHLDFLTHDRDDLIIRQKVSKENIKSATLRKKENSLIIKENEKQNDHSQIIRKYKFDKSYDISLLNECSINTEIFNMSKNAEIFEKEKEKKQKKIIMGFMIREEYQDKMTSFQKQEEKKRKTIAKHNKHFNYNFEDKDKVSKEINEKDPFQDENIDAIKNVEEHKIDLSPGQPMNKKSEQFNLPYDITIDSTNFWNNISQPNPPPIDRDAGTKIRYEKPKINFNNKSTIAIMEDKLVVEEEQKNANKKSESIPKSKLKFNISKKVDNNKNKKKKYIQIEFESTDIDPKNLEAYTETKDIGELRLKVEKELQEKKIEQQKIAQKERERIAKLEEIEEKRKELSKKNVTVDIKGELVFIKPLDLKALNEEFNKGKSNTKIIKTIETEINYIKNKNNLTVEKNPEMNLWDFKDDKNKKKKKRKEHLFFPKNGLANSPSSLSNKKGEKNQVDKHGQKYAAGSNFRIINPEVGVSIIENKQVKSGGKDFFKKFNRFSIEVFQDQLSKTATSNFYPTITEPTNINNTISDKMRRIGSVNVVKKVKKEKEPKMMSIKQSNEENNMLSIKTKNLKLALENLNLITEGEERSITTNKKAINKNYIKEVMNKLGTTKTNLNEMNVFAKTLMGSRNWGGDIYGEKKTDKYYKIPTKPKENQLQRELPVNLLKHMPRKRLPPIVNNFRINNTNNMGKTINGFYINRKTKNVKWTIDDSKKGTKTERDEHS